MKLCAFSGTIFKAGFFCRGGYFMSILVTGGTGFIGSHTCVELLEAGYDLVVFDNFTNSKPSVIDKIVDITGKGFKFYHADMADKKSLERIFSENDIDCVIHFAGYKAVGESVEKPLMYYQNNITGTLNLLETMSGHNVKRIVFSSSATVYGIPKSVPITEDEPLSVTNPYGRTKLMIEDILRDLYVSDNSWAIILLRYFNPVGGHPSGLLCEDPNGIPNNLMPRILDTAFGKQDKINVFGNDYPTVDGTGVRDYIHVLDLAKGHVKAVERIMRVNDIQAINLGTGRGYSVLELIRTFEEVNNVKIPVEFAPRRPGDVAECYADTRKAFEMLGWKAELGVTEMCRDSYKARLMLEHGCDEK